MSFREAMPPRTTHQGLCPWTPLGNIRYPDSLCPHLQILATPLSLSPNKLIDTTTNPGYQRLVVTRRYVELRYCSAVVRCGLLMHRLSAAIGIQDTGSNRHP